MENDYKALYVEAVRTLAKSTPSTPRKFIRGVNETHDNYEPKTLAAVQKALKKCRNRFVQLFDVDKLTELCERLQKSASDDVKAEIQAVLEASIGIDFTDEVLDALQPMIDELAEQFATVHSVEINYRLVNDKAVQFLRENAENTFSTLADEQAKGIYASIAGSLADEDGYSVRTIVQGIRDNFASEVLYFETKQGPRQIDATTWATTVARTETARAASYTTKAITSDLGLKTWTWYAQDTACDDCLSNDDETVAIGDEFPSGDTESPAHANCRCLCVVSMAELTSLGEDEEDTDE